MVKFWTWCTVSVVVVSCLGGCGLTGVNKSTARTPYEGGAPDTAGITRKAICLWEDAGLRDQPGRKKGIRYLTGVKFGEMVSFLPDSVVEMDGRTYRWVVLADGQQGWADHYLFAERGMLSVVIKAGEIYRRPDMMTLKDDTLEPGQIVISLEQQGDWLRFDGEEKKAIGWVSLNTVVLSWKEEDIRAALLLRNAKKEKDTEVQKRKLQHILTEPAFANSPVLPIIKEALKLYD